MLKNILWMLLLVNWACHCLLMFLSVAFFILFERKIMSLFHNRTGPNKTSFLGFVQTLLDALKFFLKQSMIPSSANKLLYTISPLFGLFTSCLLWLTLPSINLTLAMNNSFLVFFCLGSLMVLSVLLAGWASNSKYSLIGSLRSVAQSISYESVFSVLIMSMLLLAGSYSFRSVSNLHSFFFMLFSPLWLICTLAETHRAPFDFSESESELVSGYNTEYSSVNFAFVLLSEYLVLLFSCMLMSYLFFVSVLFNSVLLMVYFAILLLFLVTWVRVTVCRFRYDKLMMLSWKKLLPLTLMVYVLLTEILFFL